MELKINWDNQAVQLGRALDKRRSEGKFDFTIIVGNKKIYAERNVLACRSQYFEKMFSHPTRENQEGELNMKGVDFECVKSCIDFMYGKKYPISSEKYEEFLFVARMLLLDDLCDAIDDSLLKGLNVDNFFSARKIATKFGCSKLKEKCKSFAEKNLDSIAKQNEFQSVEKSLIRHLLSSKNVEVNEERKLEIVLHWVRFDNDRKADMIEFLQCIDVSRIPHEIGESYIAKEPLINENKDCLLFFTLEVMKAKNCLLTSHRDAKREEKILLFGRDLQTFDPKDYSVREFTRFDNPNIKTHFSVVSVCDFIYLLCEDQSLRRIKFTEGANWEQMPSMLTDHGWRPPAVVLSECIYVIGGGGGYGDATDAMERFCHRGKKWTKLVDKPKATKDAQILALGDFIYSFGGYDGSEVLSDVSRLDPFKSQWQKLSPMNEKKIAVSATSWKSIIYVAGGWERFEPLASFESYDPRTNQWTMLPEMNIGRANFKSFVIDRFLFVVGGEYPQTVEKFDIEESKWEIVGQDLHFETSMLIQ